MSRRAVLALGALGAVGALPACSDDAPSAAGSPPSKQATTPPRRTVAPTSLVWASWPEYIDVEDKRPNVRPTLQEFTRRTGIRVDYREVVTDNAKFLDSVKEPLQARRPVGFDVMVITSWAAAKLVQGDQVQRLDRELIPNARHLVAALAEPPYDPQRASSMPWQAGLTGIAYNASKVDRAVGSVQELLTRRDLAGRVGFLTEYSDTVGMMVLTQGGDPTDIVSADVENALDAISEARRNRQVRSFYGNEHIEALQEGRITACLAWSGDVLQAQADNPNIKFVVPEEGLMLWSDDLLVPRASTKGPAVAKLIDYYYDPSVAAKVAAWVNYICPVAGAREQMEKLDPDLAQNPLIFPDETILDRSYQFRSLPAAEDDRLRRAFTALSSG